LFTQLNGTLGITLERNTSEIINIGDSEDLSSDLPNHGLVIEWERLFNR
jgi:hypothetical protein